MLSSMILEIACEYILCILDLLGEIVMSACNYIVIHCVFCMFLYFIRIDWADDSPPEKPRQRDILFHPRRLLCGHS